MTNLPPLANLFAFASHDPAVRDQVGAAMVASREFREVHCDDGSPWVVGTRPLPRSVPDVDAIRARGLYFCEGRERVIHDGKENADARVVTEVLEGPIERLSARLVGDVGVVLLKVSGEAMVVRSCAGRVPFFVWTDPQSSAVSTLLAHMARFLPVPLDLDPLAIACGTAMHGFSCDNRSLIKGVHLVPPGHCGAVRIGRCSPARRYWDPRPERLMPWTRAGQKEHADSLRAVLVSSLERELSPEGGNLVSLSGGVDSSALAALAVRVARRPISTASLVPPPGPGRATELSYMEPLLDELGVQSRHFQNGDIASLGSLYHSAPPYLTPVVHPILALLDKLVEEEGVVTYTGGEFCDDLFGSGLTLHDWHDAAPFLLSVARTGRRPHGRASALRWGRDRARSFIRLPHPPLPPHLPEHVRRDLAAEYRDWRSRRQRCLADDRRPWRYLFAKLDPGLGWLEMNWEVASTLGVRRVLPFVTRQAIELAVACHPEELISDGPKTLLRRGLAADVPARNLRRADKGAWAGGLARPKVPVGVPLDDAVMDTLVPGTVPDRSTLLAPEIARPVMHLLRSAQAFHDLRRASGGRCVTRSPWVAADGGLSE